MRQRPASSHLREQRLDAGCASDAVVFLELDLGRNAKLSACATRERRCDATLARPSKVACFSVSLPITLTKTLRVTEIGRDLGARHGDEADDPRILCRFGEEGRDFDADRFGDAVRAAMVLRRSTRR